MIVVDASVVVDLLLGAGSEAGDTVARHLSGTEVASAPDLVDAEVGQVLRRMAHRGELTDDRAAVLVEALGDLPIVRYPNRGLLPRAFELRANVTVYDGLYLALAEALDRPLLTGDATLEAVPGCTATVEVLATGG